MDAEHPIVVALDLAVAVLLLLPAVMAWSRSRATSLLLLGASITWLAGFVLTDVLFWHRALLVHVVLAYPGWRPRSLPGLATVGATYVVSVLFPSMWFDDRTTFALAAALAAAASWQVRGGRGRAAHLRRWALGGALFLAAVLAGIAVARSLFGSDLWFPALLAYDVAVVGVGLILYGGLREPGVDRLTDLVVDLGDSPAGPVGEALARALGDPDLVVASWDLSQQGYVDGDGRLVPAGAAPGRALTRVDREGEPFLILVHDAALAEDRGLRVALETAARISEVNTAWQAEVAARADEVAASRRRLVDAADEERRRLEAELRVGVEARLTSLSDLLGQAPDGEHLGRAAHHLARTREELDELASGIRPRTLEAGLAPALQELVSASPVSVSLAVDVSELSADVALSAYYVCAEALTNVAKHAPGASAGVTVTGGRELTVEVSDDGPGGAESTPRGGLRGLRDRVEALGGRLVVTTDEGGTRVVAHLPLGTGPSPRSSSGP